MRDLPYRGKTNQAKRPPRSNHSLNLGGAETIKHVHFSQNFDKLHAFKIKLQLKLEASKKRNLDLNNKLCRYTSANAIFGLNYQSLKAFVKYV